MTKRPVAIPPRRVLAGLLPILLFAWAGAWTPQPAQAAEVWIITACDKLLQCTGIGCQCENQNAVTYEKYADCRKQARKDDAKQVKIRSKEAKKSAAVRTNVHHYCTAIEE